MVFTKVCLLFEIPPLCTYYQRYDMDKFLQNGYNVIVYDLSPILHPIAFRDSDVKGLEMNNGIEVKHILDMNCLRRELQENQENTFFWSTIPAYAESYPILREISKFHYGFICNVDYVAPVSVVNGKKISRYLKDISLKKIKETIFRRMPRFLLCSNMADAVVTYSNSKSILKNVLANQNTKIVYTNTLDYNEVIKVSKSNQRVMQGDYCVFIDQFFPLHPDGKEAGYSFNVDRYYGDMTRFLQNVEKIMKMPVVIAAHPKARYDMYPQYFGEFKIIQFNTCALVKDARLVISHTSISNSYVILYKKPFLLVATDEILKDIRMLPSYKAVEELVNHNTLNVSEESTLKNLEKIIENELIANEPRYVGVDLKYKLDPKESENADKSFYEILHQTMLSL